MRAGAPLPARVLSNYLRRPNGQRLILSILSTDLVMSL